MLHMKKWPYKYFWWYGCSWVTWCRLLHQISSKWGYQKFILRISVSFNHNLSQATLLKMLTFLLRSLTVIILDHSFSPFDLFLIMLLSQFLLIFLQTFLHNAFPILIGMVFVMSHKNISFNLDTSVTASEFWEWVQAGIGVYIAHQKC